MSSYLDHWSWPEAGKPTKLLHSWQAHTEERLRWAHGDARAAQVAAGRDPATQADIARWNTLGRRNAA